MFVSAPSVRAPWSFVVVAVVVAVLVGGYYLLKDKVSMPNGSETATTTATTTNDQGALTVGADTNISPKIEIVKQGTGVEAKNGDKLTVHYTGTLLDGTKFDSSLDRNQPFVVTLGAGQVIKGWDLGLVGMRVGEKRKLTIPAELAYGASGVPGSPIGPSATLVFEVELLKIN
jgi:FKBP-type peptidyl-prolyl cis-trans isomerase